MKIDEHPKVGTCGMCSKKFWRRTTTQRWCSDNCRWQARRLERVAVLGPDASRQWPCDLCGKEHRARDLVLAANLALCKLCESRAHSPTELEAGEVSAQRRLATIRGGENP